MINDYSWLKLLVLNVLYAREKVDTSKCEHSIAWAKALSMYVPVNRFQPLASFELKVKTTIYTSKYLNNLQVNIFIWTGIVYK